MPSLNRSDVHDRVDDGDALDADNLLKVDDPVPVAVRVLEAPHKVGPVRVAREERARRGTRRRVDVDEDRVLGALDDRVGVLAQAVAVRELGAGPRRAVFRHVEDHLACSARAARPALGGRRLERRDEVLLHASDADDTTGLATNAEVDVGAVLVEEVGRRVQARFPERARGAAAEEGRDGVLEGRARGGVRRLRRGGLVRGTEDERVGHGRGEVLLVVGKDAARGVGEEGLGRRRKGVLGVERL